MIEIDITYIIIGLGVMTAALAALLILIIILFSKLSGLNKKYLAFMAGSDGSSMEKQVSDNYDMMKKIEKRQQQQEMEMLDLSDHVDDCLSKVEIVTYNAFENEGGQLSFALTVLNDKKDGYILNCMHSNHGSYVYSKEVKYGKCEKELSKEEAESLRGAMNR